MYTNRFSTEKVIKELLQLENLLHMSKLKELYSLLFLKFSCVDKELYKYCLMLMLTFDRFHNFLLIYSYIQLIAGPLMYTLSLF